MIAELETVAGVWPSVRSVLSVPHSERDYDRLVELLDDLIDEVGEDESHPLASLMETLGSLVAAYEAQHVPEIPGDALLALRFLMEEHGLAQSDLPEVGSQGVVSEVLCGKRQLNTRQVKALSRRFNVSPAVFL